MWQNNFSARISIGSSSRITPSFQSIPSFNEKRKATAPPCRAVAFGLSLNEQVILDKLPCKMRRGFSLVELMVVMIILAMLAGLTVVATTGYLNTAKEKTVRVEMSTFIKALDSFNLVNGRYPTNDEGLAILKQPSKNFPNGFINKIAKDPWDTPYVYISPGTKGPYEIFSLGKDKKEGGEKENADISSRSLEDE